MGKSLAGWRKRTNPYFIWKTEYIYDSTNLKTKTIYFNEYADTSGYTEHYYLNRLLSNEKVFSSQDGLYCVYNYKYNAENNLIEKTETIGDITNIIESISYLNGSIAEKTIYDWTFNRQLTYSFKCVQVYEYD